MFDINFTEIAITAAVALTVLGPAKIPGTVRTVALWMGRLKRSFNSLKAEIEKEIGADEIRRQLRNEEIAERLKQVQVQLNNTVSEVSKDAGHRAINDGRSKP